MCKTQPHIICIITVAFKQLEGLREFKSSLLKCVVINSLFYKICRPDHMISCSCAGQSHATLKSGMRL